MTGQQPSAPLRMAVLISGGGTTLRNLLEKINSGELSAEIPLVISSNPRAAGLSFAAAAGIPTKVFERKTYADDASYSEAVFSAIRTVSARWVVMGGFLKLLLIPPDYANRVVNIHPSLIPAFCGKGFYGRRVHEAALKAGVKMTGCTVHFVDNEFDHGPIILQREVPVLPEDTSDTLAARVFAAECEALPAALRLLSGREA